MVINRIYAGYRSYDSNHCMDDEPVQFKETLHYWNGTVLYRKYYLFLFNSFAMILTGRIVAALGGGILTPLGQSIAMSIFPPEKRGTIMGMVGIAIGVAPAIGPTLSGWIIDNANWLIIF